MQGLANVVETGNGPGKKSASVDTFYLCSINFLMLVYIYANPLFRKTFDSKLNKLEIEFGADYDLIGNFGDWFLFQCGIIIFIIIVALCSKSVS